MWIEETTLRGTTVRLEPLHDRHVADLAAATQDGELWRLWETSVPAPHQVETWLHQARERRERTGDLPFAVVDRASERAIGSTRLCNPDPSNRRVEIGYTWYAETRQRTRVNTETKLLLMRHAFDVLGCIAVAFLTHRLNHRSRRAIERLGAQLDGIIRNHRIMPDGTIRDSALYSITVAEWPTVRAFLQHRLERD